LRFCLDVMLDELKHAQSQVARATKRLEELSRSERHQESAQVLQSVPGVGPITAMSFRLELPELKRFEHAGQVASFLGLAPQVRQSGPTRREGGLLKSGNPRLRAGGHLTKRTIKHANAVNCQVGLSEVAMSCVKQSKIDPNLTHLGSSV
jgi:transposase